MSREDETRIIPVRLADGTIIQVEAEAFGDSQNITFGMHIPDFDEVSTAVEGIAKSMVSMLHRVKPRKAAVEFGLQIALESGQLTTLLVKGSGTANMKITLEWSEELSER